MSFSVSIEKKPGSESYNSEDIILDYEFDGIDFDELRNLLDVKPFSISEKKGEDYLARQSRIKKKYLNITKEMGYEMLGRMWFFYEDVVYFPSEVEQLLVECLKLKKKPHNFSQSVAIDKLITACNAALSKNSGIFFGAD